MVTRRSSSKISMARDLAAFRSVSDRSSYPSTRRCGSAPFGFQDHARDLAVFGWVAVAFGVGPLRRFELKLLLELGYKVALKADANSNEIKADKTYYYEAEQGALEKFRTEKSIKVIGQTLIDMGNDNFDSATTELQSKNLMRFLINYYLGDKPLNSKQLFLNI